MEQKQPILYEQKAASRRFWRHLAGDIVAATASAILITPVVAIIDRSVNSAQILRPLLTRLHRAIVEQSSTRRPILQCLRLNLVDAIKQPKRFVFSRPFGIVWTLYAATYAVANTADTLATSSASEHVSSIVLASTCLINIPLGVWKDLRFAQLFGIGRGAVAVGASAAGQISRAKRPPMSATATFLARDTLTLFGSFTVAPWLTASLPHDLTANVQAQTIFTQLTVPALTQIGATPLHLLGLDLCNRPYRLPWPTRMIQIRHSLLSTTAVRCVRILPAFGFGCLTNTALRDYLHNSTGDADQTVDGTDH